MFDLLKCKQYDRIIAEKCQLTIGVNYFNPRPDRVFMGICSRVLGQLGPAWNLLGLNGIERLIRRYSGNKFEAPMWIPIIYK